MDIKGSYGKNTINGWLYHKQVNLEKRIQQVLFKKIKGFKHEPWLELMNESEDLDIASRSREKIIALIYNIDL